ncbi:MAG: response regulator [Rhodospirillales bacterium]|jgi:two-component system cell cycle response regulator DivK|nr:response regulator [Rhodospirillales bacterium]
MSPEPTAAEQQPGQTILVVEDDYWTRLLLHELLEAHGYIALQARDALEAYQIARDFQPNLILMDIHLPEISGLEAVRRIKQHTELCGIPVIAVTALAMKEDEQRIREGGCVEYLAKPFSSATLIDTVRRCLAA